MEDSSREIAAELRSRLGKVVGSVEVVAAVGVEVNTGGAMAAGGVETVSGAGGLGREVSRSLRAEVGSSSMARPGIRGMPPVELGEEVGFGGLGAISTEGGTRGEDSGIDADSDGVTEGTSSETSTWGGRVTNAPNPVSAAIV